MNRPLPTRLIAILFCASTLAAQETAPPAPPPSSAVTTPATDPDLPQTFDPNVLAHVVKASPFSRGVNLADSLVLTGIAGVGKQLMATLYDKETKKNWLVSEEPNALGWRLVEVTPGTKIDNSQVKIAIGVETITIRHNSDGAIEGRKGTPGGPPPRGDRMSENDRGYKRSQHGPPPEVREKFDALSESGKEKVKNLFRDNREKLMNMNEEQRRSFLESGFKKISEEDSGGGGDKKGGDKSSKKDRGN